VFLAYASARGHALIDRELYLPASWTDDRNRCRMAGVPDEVEFATKPRQAQAMIARALAAGVPFAWFTADEAYGQAKFLRAWLEERHVSYVMAIRRSDTFTISGTEQRADGLIGSSHPVLAAAVRRPPGHTARGSTTGPGSPSKTVPSPAAVTGCWPAARSATLARSPFTPATDPLRRARLGTWPGSPSRWHIEECFQQAKNEAGLDHYQVRSWRAWYAHITLSMLALAWLAASRAQVAKGELPPAARA
jgi:SRSO17 transposase